MVPRAEKLHTCHKFALMHESRTPVDATWRVTRVWFGAKLSSFVCRFKCSRRIGAVCTEAGVEGSSGFSQDEANGSDPPLGMLASPLVFDLSPSSSSGRALNVFLRERGRFRMHPVRWSRSEKSHPFAFFRKNFEPLFLTWDVTVNVQFYDRSLFDLFGSSPSRTSERLRWGERRCCIGQRQASVLPEVVRCQMFSLCQFAAKSLNALACNSSCSQLHHTTCRVCQSGCGG